MKRLILPAVVLVAAVAAAWSWTRPTSDRVAARLERGRYLVEGPAHCFMCHSELDWTREGPAPLAQAKGGGQSPFCEHTLPWLSAPNISPTAVADTANATEKGGNPVTR